MAKNKINLGHLEGTSQKTGDMAIHTLDVADINPYVRYAHQTDLLVNTGERIIFDHELVLVLQGQMEYADLESAITLAPGQLVFVRPFHPHRFRKISPAAEHAAIHFDLAREYPPATDDPSGRTPYAIELTYGMRFPTVILLPDADPIRQWLLQAVDCYTQSTQTNSFSLLRARVCLLQVLVALLQRGNSTEQVQMNCEHHILLQRVIKRIEQNITEPWQGVDVAEYVGVSVRSLNRMFHQCTGCTPMLYLRRLRIHKAKQLLREPGLSIKEIAARTGFADPFHFSRVFHQIDGLSPTAYRRSVLAQDLSRID